MICPEKPSETPERPLVFVVLGGLYLLLDRAGMYHWWHGALIGGIFGFGFFLGGVSWVYVSLSVFGGNTFAGNINFRKSF